LLGGLCGQLKSDFRPELGINLLQLFYSPLDIEEEVQLQLVFGNVPLGIASTEAFSVGVFFVGLLSKA
jgi:hypothetical protein